MLYAWGEDIYKTGILGISQNTYFQQDPAPLISLIDYRIRTFQVTNDKAWAIDNSGKLFVWGSFRDENMLEDSKIMSTPFRVKALMKFKIRKADVFSSICEESDQEYGTNI